MAHMPKLLDPETPNTEALHLERTLVKALQNGYKNPVANQQAELTHP